MEQTYGPAGVWVCGTDGRTAVERVAYGRGARRVGSLRRATDGDGCRGGFARPRQGGVGKERVPFGPRGGGDKAVLP